jgi:hypothetical protein
MVLSRTLRRLSEILESGKRAGVFGEENPFMLQLMIVSTLTSYNTTRTLRERIVEGFDDAAVKPEPHFGNVVDDLSKKIVKALTC